MSTILTYIYINIYTHKCIYLCICSSQSWFFLAPTPPSTHTNVVCWPPSHPRVVAHLHFGHIQAAGATSTPVSKSLLSLRHRPPHSPWMVEHFEPNDPISYSINNFQLKQVTGCSYGCTCTRIQMLGVRNVSYQFYWCEQHTYGRE